MAFHRKGHESLTSRSVVLGARQWGYCIGRFSVKRETGISECHPFLIDIPPPHTPCLPFAIPHLIPLDPCIPITRGKSTEGQELVPGYLSSQLSL